MAVSISDRISRVTHPTVELNSRRRLTFGEELITCLLGTWMITGLYLDGWAHQNTDLNDSITTPWHAVFYSGWAAIAGWIGWVVLRERRAGKRGLAGIPQGYAVGVFGVAVFFVGGMGDQVWHTMLGVEQNLNAFFSPTHMLLAFGMVLMLSSPLRAAWSSNDTDRPSLFKFAPVLWSMILSALMINYLYNYFSMFNADSPTIGIADTRALVGDAPQGDAFRFLVERIRIEGVAQIHFTNFVLLGMTLFVLRRWRLPFLSLTLFFSAMALATHAIYEFPLGWTTLAAVAGGLIADILVNVLDPSPSRVVEWRVFSALMPLFLWSCYFASLFIFYDVGWPAEMWTGTITLTALTGLGIGVWMRPMDVPATITR
ncbi:MAG: hypothetical protein QOC92_2174 [Acidimicrobiaceae bacterium]|jgi:hypothetical protein